MIQFYCVNSRLFRANNYKNLLYIYNTLTTFPDFKIPIFNVTIYHINVLEIYFDYFMSFFVFFFFESFKS